MITHYVYLSSYDNRGDLVLEADRFEPREQVQRYWHPIEDCTTRDEALVRAKEYVAVLEALEEPKVGANILAFGVNASGGTYRWQGLIEEI